MVKTSDNLISMEGYLGLDSEEVDIRQEIVLCLSVPEGAPRDPEFLLREKCSPDGIVVLTGSCGKSATYENIAAIPIVDVPCPCGSPKHWLVRWM